MTCIVGMEYGGKVYMGADSASISGWDRNVTAMPKIFSLWSEEEPDRQRGKFLLGCAGSPRIAQILRYHLCIKSPTTIDNERYLVKEFIEPARWAIHEYGAAQVENATEATSKNSKFLLGFKGSLYLVDDDFQLTRFASGIAAVGVGDSYAMGAMLALKTRDPEKRILKALEIAGQLCMGVCPPYHVEVL
jgi:hypothetical protein